MREKPYKMVKGKYPDFHDVLGPGTYRVSHGGGGDAGKSTAEAHALELNRAFDQGYERRKKQVTETAERRLARAVLIFYSGGQWSDEIRAEWKELTGCEDATTRNLANFAREVLGIEVVA